LNDRPPYTVSPCKPQLIAPSVPADAWEQAATAMVRSLTWLLPLNSDRLLRASKLMELRHAFSVECRAALATNGIRLDFEDSKVFLLFWDRVFFVLASAFPIESSPSREVSEAVASFLAKFSNCWRAARGIAPQDASTN